MVSKLFVAILYCIQQSIHNQLTLYQHTVYYRNSAADNILLEESTSAERNINVEGKAVTGNSVITGQATSSASEEKPHEANPADVVLHIQTLKASSPKSDDLPNISPGILQHIGFKSIEKGKVFFLVVRDVQVLV